MLNARINVPSCSRPRLARRPLSALSRVGALSGAVLAAGLALAGPTPTVRLVYEGLDGCSSEHELREAVAIRLGYDPFRDGAPVQIRARVRREGRSLVGHLEMRNDQGKVTGSRELRAPGNDCSELTSTMAIALSLAVDPFHTARPPASSSASPVASSAPVPVVSASVSAPASAPLLPASAPAASSAPAVLLVAPAASSGPVDAMPPGPAPVRSSLRLGLGAMATLGAAPGVTFGPLAQVGVRWRGASLNVEGRADLATATSSEHGGASSALTVATLAPCGHVGVVVGCLLGSLGVLRGEGQEATVTREQTALYYAVGARLGVEIAVIQPLWLRINVDAMAPLKPVTLTIDGKEIWTTPSFWGGLGAGVGFSF